MTLDLLIHVHIKTLREIQLPILKYEQ